jgi:thiosulfate/3-mercaptopyruvate sulfurtransferase
MRELVAATGITKVDDIIVYCGTSREASLLFETIKNLLGYPKVRLYEGSMTEWSALSQYPVETAGKVVQPTPISATTTGE